MIGDGRQFTLLLLQIVEEWIIKAGLIKLIIAVLLFLVCYDELVVHFIELNRLSLVFGWVNPLKGVDNLVCLKNGIHIFRA